MNYEVQEAKTEQDLFPQSGLGFTNVKSTYPQNEFELVRDRDTGRTVAALSAVRRTFGSSTVSKQSLVHEGFTARKGDVLSIVANIKIQSASANGLYLLDLECTTCWPSVSLVSDKSPGIRLYVDAETGRVGVDRGKIGLRSNPFRSEGVRFPVGKWVRVVWKIGLSDRKNGWSIVRLDGKTVMRSRGVTLPRRSTFAAYGIALKDQKYDYVEVGVTANESGRNQTVLLSNIRLELEKGGL